MECVSDRLLWTNRDWDPLYLSELFSDEFFDFSDHWISKMSDFELVSNVEKIEKYSPIVEDISLEDNELCTAVEKIEEE